VRSLHDHLENPALGDPPRDATIEGCAGGSCGVVARFFFVVDEASGLILECSARVRGRAAAFATASALCEAARGTTMLDAARVGLTTLHESFAAMDEEDRERALVVEDAFHHGLGLWAVGRSRTADTPVLWHDGATLDVLVAMSGGVDSAVALHRTRGDGSRTVAGATLRLWIDPQAPDPEAACCAPVSVRRARRTCHALGVAHFSIDLRSAFLTEVVAPFVAEYQAGSTPNPCVRCNGSFRLDELDRVARALGASRVATGHYVRTAERDGRTLVRSGVDERKDQSYMLATINPDVLARYEFPLGELRKPQVRAEAAALGLEQATVRESQEVCFLGGGDYRAFLERAGSLGPSGDIVDTNGLTLGSHDGIARFTPGQRRGLPNRTGGDNAPIYVLDTDPSTGRVTVGDRTQLERTTVRVSEFTLWVTGTTRATVQPRFRIRGGGVPATISAHCDGTADLLLDRPLASVAPGQLACLYDEDGVVVGSGRIIR
jgi:tRNA-specific 2-thiouridylase